MKLIKVFNSLLNRFGPQHWWPVTDKDNSQFEIIVGAILTQQTAWKNVEKAIDALKVKNLLSPFNLSKARPSKIQRLIKPSGYYRQKSKRIINLSRYILKEYKGNLKKLLNKPLEDVRRELLSLDGIGKETADSILLYAGNKPIFPIDAYTIRIVNRVGLFNEKTYDGLQNFFHQQLPADVNIYNEFHALLVKLGKIHCKTKPECDDCPLIRCNYRQK